MMTAISDEDAEKWINAEVESKDEVSCPVVIFMVGGPGAGKATVRKKCIEEVNRDFGLGGASVLTEQDFVVAGIDRIVKYVFGGDRNCAGCGVDPPKGKWSAQSLLWEQRKLALSGRRNLIIDGYGAGHFTLFEENVIYRKPSHSAEARNGFVFPRVPTGYKKVYICHASTNPHIALERARRRAADPDAPDEDRGRIVPESSFFDKHDAVDDIVPSWQTLARENPDVIFLEYNNNAKEPVLVQRIEMVRT
eukprot:TRINITY_DN59108_c0_g1_i1.p1 TRINITY_DN59108_c0_g1~~TRINITY_DN59108_c0_g1_i1.p1  ORF type:complete len:250 (+),score=36.54 TRINITY_DN59108_c0_g1_i1:141-890(+)